MQLDDIPELKRALSRAAKIEERLRSVAFVPIQDVINGIIVDQFRLKHLVLCQYIESPFMVGGTVTDEDVVRFMWIVSGQYNPDGKGRAEYVAALVKAKPIDAKFVRSIDRYIERALMDLPGGSRTGKTISASFAASVIHRLALTYGWDDEAILEKPMARICQCMNWINAERNPKTPQFNRLQDQVKRKFLNRQSGNGNARPINHRSARA